LQGW